jgi:hypothetical protein
MYSITIEQELYGEKWNKVISFLRKAGITTSKSPLNKAVSVGAGAVSKSARNIIRAYRTKMKNLGYNLKNYNPNPKTAEEVKSINETLTHNMNEINKYERRKVSEYRRNTLKNKFNSSEKSRTKNYRIAGGVTGAGIGGTLGYALSKRATKNTEPSKKRTAIRVGSTIAGVALGGYAGQYAGKKLAGKGVKVRYKEYLKNK